MKIRINRIFGKYNNEIDLDNNCNILIGENGIGKSTTIKIINYLLKLDYVSLIKYYFDSIEIITNSKKIIIRYKDLTLKKEYLLKEYCGDNYDKYILLKEDFKLLQKEHTELKSPYELEIDDIDDREKIFNILQFNWDFENFYNNIDNRLLYKILKFDVKKLTNEKIILDYENKGGLSSNYLNFIKKIYANAKVVCDDNGKYYNESNIKNKVNEIKMIIKKLNFRNILIIDMASDFNVTNDLDRIFVTNNREKDFIDKNYVKMLEHNKKEKNILNHKIFFGSQFDIRKNILENNNINVLKDNFVALREYGIIENKIDLGYYLFNNIYNEQFLNEFKEDLYNFIYEKLKNNHDYYPKNEKTKKFISIEKDFNKIKLFIK